MSEPLTLQEKIAYARKTATKRHFSPEGRDRAEQFTMGYHSGYDDGLCLAEKPAPFREGFLSGLTTAMHKTDT